MSYKYEIITKTYKLDSDQYISRFLIYFCVYFTYCFNLFSLLLLLSKKKLHKNINN